jgi:hypothetical protein
LLSPSLAKRFFIPVILQAACALAFLQRELFGYIGVFILLKYYPAYIEDMQLLTLWQGKKSKNKCLYFCLKTGG